MYHLMDAVLSLHAVDEIHKKQSVVNAKSEKGKRV